MTAFPDFGQKLDFKGPSLSAKQAASQGLLFLCPGERWKRTPGFVIAKRFRSNAEKDSLSLRKAWGAFLW